MIRWVDFESRGNRNLAMEDADENDLININNPAPVRRHHLVKAEQLRSSIKVPRDSHQFHHLYPSKVFQGRIGFIEPYVPEGNDAPTDQ